LLGALVVYRIGAHIPVPGIDPVQLAALFKQNEGGILGMFNMFSGGALSRFTVFALGIMPYISASIIMQLASIVSPQLEALKKEGEAGRRKITQYTRYFTVALALFQAFGIAVALEAQPGLVIDPGLGFRFVTVVTLLTGTMFLMWLGEQITERGLGNGISIIIFAGIAAGLPSALGGLFTLVSNGSIGSFSAILRPSIALVCGAITRNSSPPQRSTMSDSRIAARRRLPTSTSTASPAAWPCSSLMRLKWSMSSRVKQSAESRRGGASPVRLRMRSRKERRLNRPVSGSCAER